MIATTFYETATDLTYILWLISFSNLWLRATTAVCHFKNRTLLVVQTNSLYIELSINIVVIWSATFLFSTTAREVKERTVKDVETCNVTVRDAVSISDFHLYILGSTKPTKLTTFFADYKAML